MIDTTKLQIFKAALIEFGSKGYELASTNRIAQDASVSKGIIFKHYKTKANLFFEVFQTSLSEFLNAYQALDFSHIADPIEKIVAYVHWKGVYFANQSYAGAVLMEGFSSPPAELIDKMTKLMGETRALSLDSLFQSLDRSRLRSDITEEVFMKTLQIAVAGMQAVYIHKGITQAQLESIKEENITFLTIIIRGMEKDHE